MSAEKIIRVKMTLPEGVVIQTSVTAASATPVRFHGLLESMFDIAKGVTVSELSERIVSESQRMKSDAPIEVTLECPLDRRGSLASVLLRLVEELKEE